MDTNPFNPDGMDEAPPPPYESVVMDSAVQGVSAVRQGLNVMHWNMLEACSCLKQHLPCLAHLVACRRFPVWGLQHGR